MLTAAGETLRLHAEGLLDRAAAARRAVQDLVGLRGGRLIIGAIPSVSACLLPTAIAAFRKLHPQLKKHAFLNPKESDSDPYESSQIDSLLVNASGIYGVYSYREVFDYERFWAIGSGRNYALGAMHAVFEGAAGAAEVARAGVQAGIEFDKSSGAPFFIHEIRSKPASAKRRTGSK